MFSMTRGLPQSHYLLTSKVKSSITVVTREFGKAKGITVDHLSNGKEGDHLDDHNLVEGRERLQASRHRFGTRESDSGGSYKVTNHCKHRDTSVLDFNLAKAVERLVVGILQQSHGVKETKL